MSMTLPQDAVRAVDLETSYVQRRLPGGVRVLVAHQPWLKSFAATLSFRTGWCDEPRAQRGLTHLLEHLAFAGANEPLTDQLGRRGVFLNATTEWELTSFVAAGHCSQIDGVLQVFANILRPAPLPAGRIESELRIIAHELMAHGETPVERDLRRITAEILGDPQLTLPPLSSVRNLARLQPAEIAQHARRLFACEHAHLTVVGPFEPGALLETIAARFGSAGRGPALEAQSPLPPGVPDADNRLIVRRYPGAQAMLGVCHAYGPRDRHPLVAVAVLNEILGGSPHSWLFRSIRRDAQLSYMVASDVIALRASVLLKSYAVLPQRNALPALERMLDCTAQLASGAIDVDDFESARETLRTRTEALQDSARELCLWLSTESAISSDESPLTPQTLAQQYAALTVSEVARCAQQILQPARRTTVLLGPIGLVRRLLAGRLVRRAAARGGGAGPGR